MQVLAFEIEGTDGSGEIEISLLKEEAKSVLFLYQENIIRNIWFQSGKPLAVLLLECKNLDEAKMNLAKLPLVQSGKIDFNYIPLVPYPGFGRLFQDE